MRRHLTLLFSLILLSLALWASVRAQEPPREDSLYAVSLHRMMRFRVCLPALEGAGRRYPTILLLHGFGGNYRNWTDRTNVRNMALLDTLLIVTPDAGDSWYLNSATDSTLQYENAIVNDLLTFVRAKYPADPQQLGIAGLSMGGYGALTLGLRHPGVFRFIGDLSGGLDVPFVIPDLEKYGRGGLRPSLTRAFGTDTTGWAALAPGRLAGKIDSAHAPYVYMATGIQDE
ncbi:MAG TPA: alpha/beta hydrolase-fold protein, partial [Bacteroidota bacterium]|nr:alpha/beta hydrolase-fold protein [Bacteroidota bacterium]